MVNLIYLDKYYEAEETFLQAFKIRSTVKTFATFLRLGYTFLYRKAWGDARAVLTRACELKPNSSLAWLGLGNLSLQAYNLFFKRYFMFKNK